MISRAISLVAVLGFFTASSSWGAEPPATSVTPARPPELDVVYGHASDKDLLLDFFPAELASPLPSPAIIYIHGGGWARGSKQRMPPTVRAAANGVGAALISVDYRLVPASIFPAQAEDCTRAVQFVRHRAGNWGIDPQRMALFGESAGGQLSLWVGLHDDAAKPEAGDPVERESSRVAAIVNYFGPTDFHLIGTVKHTHPAFWTLLGLQPGDPFDKFPAAALDAVSPVTYISADDPPVLTCQGDHDDVVPLEHAVELDARLKEKGVESVLIKIEGAGHGWTPDHDPATEVAGFLKKHLLVK